MNFREEKDSMGTVKVPENAYYGSQTQRAVDNFSDSGIKMPLALIQSLALIKVVSAGVNAKLGLLDETYAHAIETAARQVAGGQLDDQFVVDLFQTGSGTSTNMNMNEVLASRANEILTGQKGGRSPVHPNDHVNLGQSSNDVIPSAIHIAAALKLRDRLVPALSTIEAALIKKYKEFSGIHKIGRTHLQDAVPMTLGEEFSGYARQMTLAKERIESVVKRLSELALGGTAVGTGLNAHPEFASMVIDGLNAETGMDFTEAVNHFEAQAARDAALETSGILKTIAAGLVKIANDIRWLGSGPRCGIGELKLPALQPGSSIMPGKVNPVIPEAVIQMAYQVMGNDATIFLAAQSGSFELNVTLPLIAYNLLQSIDLLSLASRLFAEKCINGLAADVRVCEEYLEKSLALVTALVPHIGYDRAAQLAKKAYQNNLTIREVVRAEKIMPDEELTQILSVKKAES
ncbi:MAG: class II fumarate hydratase [Desulfobacteraceae bacterium]|jgi:fumarate hydratase class II